MRYLLDTHVLLWSQAEPQRIGAGAKKALLAKDAVLLISPISTLEIAQFANRGRITLGLSVHDYLTKLISALRLQTLPLSHESAIEAYALPGTFHPDPADRLLVAAARVDGATLVSGDRRILEYAHAQTLDAQQ